STTPIVVHSARGMLPGAWVDFRLMGTLQGARNHGLLLSRACTAGRGRGCKLCTCNLLSPEPRQEGRGAIAAEVHSISQGRRRDRVQDAGRGRQDAPVGLD